jgi:hypothetical protein
MHICRGYIFCGSFKSSFSNSVTLWLKVIGLLVNHKSDYLIADIVVMPCFDTLGGTEENQKFEA